MTDAELLAAIAQYARSSSSRLSRAAAIAHALRDDRHYRWVGLYDVDEHAGIVRVVAWSGPAAPEYPEFPISKGLTARAICTRTTVNIGNVFAQPDYLTALRGTASEIIVPALYRGSVVGTIDVESDKANAFSSAEQEFLERAAKMISRFWA